MSIAHARDVYALFYDETGTLGFQGILSGEESNEVSLSSIPKQHPLRAYLYVNHDGYSSCCKDYREYWDWVEKRNNDRFQNTLDHGKNYDAKNMMHTFRLLDMAVEILEQGEVLVRRPNRAELLQIRAGAFEYDELIKQAEAKVNQVDKAAAQSSLPDQPDLDHINQILVELRTALY
ncbi:hypothetical protein [Spirosoma sp. KNUC1025]|uniref:hypothetical protein n=1 Tax=Spirosoma sp. KNUC1025 TaxID=2894082 RepID=UPI003869B245|nr:nucleotidyltransferase domain-containing protein [Spirosoma sp. KNUC1025]